jgi:hypothetical protein
VGVLEAFSVLVCVLFVFYPIIWVFVCNRLRWVFGGVFGGVGWCDVGHIFWWGGLCLLLVEGFVEGFVELVYDFFGGDDF